MAGAPWYQDGLRFECTQCGDCCTGEPGYVWVNKAEMEAIAARLNLPLDEFKAKYVHQVGVRYSLKERKNGDCLLLDEKTRKCTVYEDRPRQCKTWPFWESNVRTPATWAETCEACPGCNRGELVPLEGIREQLAIVRV